MTANRINYKGHEGSFHAFGALAKEGRKVRKSRQTFATADHYVPTVERERGLAGIADPEICGMVELLERNARENGLLHLGIDESRARGSCTMEGRLTVCNMSVAAGARAGMVAPDDTTYEYLHGREFAPHGADWEGMGVAAAELTAARTVCERYYCPAFVYLEVHLQIKQLYPRPAGGKRASMTSYVCP